MIFPAVLSTQSDISFLEGNIRIPRLTWPFGFYTCPVQLGGINLNSGSPKLNFSKESL